MSQKPKVDAIGFPPPLMGEVSLRLPVLGEGDGWIALDKPAALLIREHPWDGSRPNLDSALNLQLKAGKPELVRRGASMFGSVYYLDPEISGVALFAKNRDALADLRNIFGSGDAKFRFILISSGAEGEVAEAFVADAPLLPHNVKPKMIPSTAKGKKCSTSFRQLAISKQGYTVWEATTTFFRPHQVRAHAAVHGIAALGDALYGGAPVPSLRDLEPRKRGAGLSKVLFDGMAIHLLRCDFGFGCLLESEPTKSLRSLLKRLELGLEF